MSEYFTQTDIRWKNVKFPYNNKTIGQIGCLITSISNILWERGKKLTPPDVLNLLYVNNGLTNSNLVLWDSVFKIFQLKHTKYFKESVKKLSKETLTIDHFVVEIDCETFTHFCNIISFEGLKIKYFDVFDGKEKIADDNKIVSIRRFE